MMRHAFTKLTELEWLDRLVRGDEGVETVGADPPVSKCEISSARSRRPALGGYVAGFPVFFVPR